MGQTDKPKRSSDSGHSTLLCRFTLEKKEQLNILLVEDAHSDIALTELALTATGIPLTLNKIKRGEELIARLSIDRRCHADALPDLILLDLGLPGMNGFEIMDEMAEMSPNIRAIPIVILTAQSQFEYICKDSPLYIMAYLQKPCSAEQLKDILTRVQLGCGVISPAHRNPEGKTEITYVRIGS